MAQRRRWRGGVLAVVVVLGPAACSDGPDGSPGTTRPGTLDWQVCGPVVCASLDVPIDRTRPSAGALTLHLAMRPADDPAERVGVLFVNPGGPGIGGTYLVEQAEEYFSDALLDRFDVVSWDPRGTGRSSHVDCVDDLDAFFSLDPSPDDAAEREALVDAARSFRAGCRERSGDLLAHIGTVDSAEDADAIRAAMAEETVSWLGFSYGSELALTHAALHPDRVRRSVLDGAVAPWLPSEERSALQAAAFEAALESFVLDCDGRPDCALRRPGGAGPAMDALLARLDDEPVPTPEGTVRRPAAGPGVASVAIIQALYDRAYWPNLAGSLDRAERGDGGGLLDLYDAYLDRRSDGSWADTMEAYLAIGCADDRGPGTPQAVAGLTDRLAAAAPRIGAAFGALTMWCTGWPEPEATERPRPASGEGVLVVATTGDTATPFEAGRSLAAELEGAGLLVWEGRRHGAYVASACVRSWADGFLLDGRLPPPGERCTDGSAD